LITIGRYLAITKYQDAEYNEQYKDEDFSARPLSFGGVHISEKEYQARKKLGLSEIEKLSSPLIKTAFRKKALHYHPDMSDGDSDDFHKVKEAYEFLISIVPPTNKSDNNKSDNNKSDNNKSDNNKTM